MQFSIKLLISVVLPLVLYSTVPAQNVSLDELITKHMASIAAKTAFESQRSRFLMGSAEFAMKGSVGQVSGKVGILSDVDRVVWAMQFSSNDYPQDKFGFDGKKVIVNRTSPAGRSFLTQFINDNRKIIEDGLLGGVLAGTWSLNTGPTAGRLKISGSRKIDERETIVVEYTPRGGDFSTKLYFDKETFRHVRSEHTVARAAVQGSGIDNSAGQTGSIIKLVEEFSDFKKMGEFTLPSSYKITYSNTGSGNVSTLAGTSREASWTFKFTDYSANQALSEDAFTL